MARGRGDGRPPEMTVRDAVVSEPKLRPDKNYEVGISLLVMAGYAIAHGASYQYLVNSAPVGHPNIVADGRATGKLVLPKGKATLAVELKHPYFGTRLISLGEKDVGEEQKKELKKKELKLEVLGFSSDEEKFFISLARVDESGAAKKGQIVFFDPLDAENKKENTEEGVANIAVDLGETPRKIIFYLPEKPGAKIIQDIPPKPKPPERTEPSKNLFQRMKEAYEKGKKGE